jgi:hypothetical protein
MAYFVKEKSLDLGSTIADGFKYNIQVLPDIVASSALLFGILFQSAPMAVFSAAIFTVGFLHKHIAEFVSQVVPGTASSSDLMCSGQFPGVTFSHLMGLSSAGQFGKLSSQKVPSYYTTLMGFIIGWIGSLPSIYSQEIDASPTKKSATLGGLISLGILAILVIVHRTVVTGCEGFIAVLSGLLIGFGIGILMVFGISSVTERRATNILGLPLLKNKTAEGKPIYVCERPSSD